MGAHVVQGRGCKVKRFTETEKWKDSWFRKLKPSSKLLWLYILDTCDNAGFWEYDLEMCAFVTKMTEEQVEGALKGLDRGLTGSKCGECFYVNNFLRHQKNTPLNPKNKAHLQIIRIIETNIRKFDKKKGAIKGLASLSGKGIGKGIGSVKVEVVYSDDFLKFWESYPRKEKKDEAFKSFSKYADLPPVDEIIAKVELFKLSDSWKDDGGKYIPMPTTWLNQRRWKEDPKANESNQSYPDCPSGSVPFEFGGKFMRHDSDGNPYPADHAAWLKEIGG